MSSREGQRLQESTIDLPELMQRRFQKAQLIAFDFLSRIGAQPVEDLFGVLPAGLGLDLSGRAAIQQLVELEKIIPAGASDAPIDEIGDPLPAVDFALVGAQQVGQPDLLCLEKVCILHRPLLLRLAKSPKSRKAELVSALFYRQT